MNEQFALEQAVDAARAMLQHLATRAMGLTGADVERIVREARLKARRSKRTLRVEDLEDGIRGNRPQLPESLRWRLAYHEAGHAVIHHALNLGPIYGISIDSQGGGYNLLELRSDDTTLPYYENVLVMLMAGRAAEQLALGAVSSGSGGSGDSDLARATRMAFEMERTFGFGHEFPLLYRPHRDLSTVLDYDRVLAARLHAMLEKAQRKAEDILRERRTVFDALAKALFEELALDEGRVRRFLSGEATHR